MCHYECNFSVLHPCQISLPWSAFNIPLPYPRYMTLSVVLIIQISEYVAYNTLMWQYRSLNTPHPWDRLVINYLWIHFKRFLSNEPQASVCSVFYSRQFDPWRFCREGLVFIYWCLPCPWSSRRGKQKLFLFSFHCYQQVLVWNAIYSAK